MSGVAYCENCVNMEYKGDFRMGSFANRSKDIYNSHMCSKLFRQGSKHPSTFCVHYLHVLFVIFVCLSLFGVTSGFNLDITSKIEFRGPNTGSYYGYTVAMMNQRGQDKWILIGAPKDRSANLPLVEKPGAIHKCTFSNDFNRHSCDELFIDDKVDSGSATFDGINRIYTHGRDDQWLGASLDVQHDKGIVTCASRWFNKYYEGDGYFFMNGLCYEIPLDFNPNNIITIPALVDAEKQTMTVPGSNITKLNYGMGYLGGSVHYVAESSNLLLGAPGLRYFTGGFIDVRQTGDAYITQYEKAPTEINEMLGYAMTSGKYFGGQTYFVIGAPRDHLTGKVYLFRADSASFILERADATLNGSSITEIPVNGYFGAALCSADVNNDGLDDLLVASPFYSNGDLEETGAVLVYLGQADMKFKPMTTILTGSEKSGSRFGSAMASLGDLNKDNYNDVVIGAPYEDDLQGAIYVYNGCKTGIWPHYSQRIAAAEVRPGLQSFGISFSKPEDMDDDDINDIAVGAYLSDSAYLLFGQPVINMAITMETSVPQIDKDTNDMCPSKDGSTLVPCFQVSVCFSYDYREYPNIDVNVTTFLDTFMGEYNRVAWQTNANSVKSTIYRLFSRSENCIHEKVLIKSTSDLVTPVRIKASYDVVSIPSGSSRVEPTVNKFDGNNPDKQILIATKMLDFKKDCPNNECQSDLHLTAKASYGSSEDYFIMGSSALVIDVSILKSGDPSYSSTFFMSMPSTLQYQQVTKVYGEPEINCGFVIHGTDDSEEEDMESLDYLQRRNIPKIANDEFLLACSFGNPMYENTGVRFQISLHVPDAMNSTNLEFRLNATTLSTEIQPADNALNIDVQVRNQVKTTFKAISRPTYLTMKEDNMSYVTSHIYELQNKGPSPLPSSDVLILYPQIQQGGKPYLYLNTTSWSCAHPCRIACSFPDTVNTAPVVFAANIGPTYFIDKTPNEENIGESKTIADMKHIDCTKGGCSRYECKLSDIPARESAVVTLDFVVTGDVLDATNGGAAMKARSEGFVKLRDQFRLITDTMEHTESVYSDLLPLTPPPQRIPWWIILLSVLAGLLLIVLVVIIFWKAGFFKRKQRDEMNKMRFRGTVEGGEYDKMMPDEVDPNGYN